MNPTFPDVRNPSKDGKSCLKMVSNSNLKAIFHNDVRIETAELLFFNMG